MLYNKIAFKFWQQPIQLILPTNYRQKCKISYHPKLCENQSQGFFYIDDGNIFLLTIKNKCDQNCKIIQVTDNRYITANS